MKVTKIAQEISLCVTENTTESLFFKITKEPFEYLVKWIQILYKYY